MCLRFLSSSILIQYLYTTPVCVFSWTFCHTLQPRISHSSALTIPIAHFCAPPYPSLMSVVSLSISSTTVVVVSTPLLNVVKPNRPSTHVYNTISRFTSLPLHITNVQHQVLHIVANWLFVQPVLWCVVAFLYLAETTHFCLYSFCPAFLGGTVPQWAPGVKERQFGLNAQSLTLRAGTS